ncbi:MAG: c-type cytochrome [Bacteroidota bacterium]
MRSLQYIFLLLSFLYSLNLTAQEGAGDPALGDEIFGAQCATCHAKNMKTDATGPALGGVEERWSDYPREDLYAWIRNSQKMIADGHPRAQELWADWKPTVMNSFTSLTDDDIENLLAYISEVYVGTYPKQVAGGPAIPVPGEKVDEGINKPLFVALFFILAILAVVLARIISNLNYLAEVKEGNKAAKRRTLVDVLTSKGMIGFLIFAVVIIFGYTTVNNAIELGRQQGYEPEQPIKFSHATHSGLHKIECQYCHDGARRSKHSVIPATNTCMNCHRAIKVGSKHGTQELTKIYASIGYDPSSDKYIENYEEMSEEEVKEIYTKWIGDTYVKENSDNPKLLAMVGDIQDKQWDNIVSSLTNDIKTKVQGPIQWERIHNMPDHVYFNHAQHVTVGKQECQTCHGPIQEMEVVYQYSPLSMGWCINCHRQTEVQFTNNDYYKSYEKYHEELKSGDREKVTVEDVGGLGCQKCHY